MSVIDRGPAATDPQQLATLADVARALSANTGGTGTGNGGGYTDVPVALGDGQSFTIRKFAGSNLCVWFGQLTNNTGAAIAAGTTLGTIPEGVRPRAGMRVALTYTSDAAITGNIRPNFTFGFVGSMTTGSTVNMAGVSYIAEG